MDVKQIADKFPTLKIRNKTGRVVTIPYEGGDSLDVMPNSIRGIPTEGLSQLPDATKIQFISPSRAEITAAVKAVEEDGGEEGGEGDDNSEDDSTSQDGTETLSNETSDGSNNGSEKSEEDLAIEALYALDAANGGAKEDNQ